MRLQKSSKILAISLAVLSIFSLFCLTSCKQNEAADPWADAVYTEDKTFGEGAKNVAVEVIVADKSITFTLKTDKENLADALLEHKLVEGDEGAYGLYIKKVNGMLADYEVNGYYWSLTKDGEMHMSGASDTEISDGERYEFTYAK